jgi:hypothetical protein
MRTILRTRRVSNRQPAATGSCDAPFVLAQRLDQQCAADFRFCHALQHDGEACVITRLGLCRMQRSCSAHRRR